MLTARLRAPLFVAAAFCFAAAAAERPMVVAAAPTPGVDPKTSAALNVPGMDFSSLPAAAQKELASVFSDEFCYCGCPHTLGQCLKEHKSCRHSKRMANLAAQDTRAGASGAEVIQRLGRYYQGFRDVRRKFKVDDRLCKGAKDAKITIVEFADFECPYCGFFRPLLDEFSKKHSDIRFCYAPYPLPNHQGGQLGAVAAMVARDKGKFWEMHERLYAHQMELSLPVIKGLAAEIGISGAEVQKAIDSGKYKAELDGYRELGKQSGVNVVPTLYINGREFVLVGPPVEQLEHSTDDELEWMSSENSWAKD